MVDTNIPFGNPGIASFATESSAGPVEPRYGEGVPTTTHMTVTAGADLDLPLYSVVSVIGGVLALAALGSGAGSATGTVTFATAVPADGDTVTIAGHVYTFRSAPAAVDDVQIGATLNETAANLASAINADPDGDGTAYYTGTAANDDVVASVTGAEVTVIAANPGDEGNAITLAESGTNITVSGANLTGGDDDVDTKPYGILAEPVVMTNGQSMPVSLYREGHWNMDALTWDASYATEASKKTAFEGSLSPNIFVSKKKFPNDAIPV